MRFLENHDEPRIADKLPAGLERAAAVAIATLPGATMWHEGQFEGRGCESLSSCRGGPRNRRTPNSPPGTATCSAVVARSLCPNGGVALLEPTGWPDNQSCRNLIAWSWDGRQDRGRPRHVVVINFSQAQAQARDPAALAGPGRAATGAWRTCAAERTSNGTAASSPTPGLYVDMRPGQFYLLALR